MIKPFAIRYAISDIHGCTATFRRLLEKIEFTTTDELYLLGDYIDRGPDSMGVIEYIWQLQETNHQVHCLLGNHEEILLKYLDGRARLYEWQPPADRRGKVHHWLTSLPHFINTPGYLLVHAGFNFRDGQPLEDTYAMLWARYWQDQLTYLWKLWLDDRIIVHGHTPETAESVRRGVARMQDRRYVCIDSGCAHQRAGMGVLTALNLDTGAVVQAGNRG